MKVSALTINCRYLRLVAYTNPLHSIQKIAHLDLTRWNDPRAADIWPMGSLADRIPESMQIRSLCGPLTAPLSHIESEFGCNAVCNPESIELCLQPLFSPSCTTAYLYSTHLDISSI